MRLCIAFIAEFSFHIAITRITNLFIASKKMFLSAIFNRNHDRLVGLFNSFIRLFYSIRYKFNISKLKIYIIYFLPFYIVNISKYGVFYDEFHQIWWKITLPTSYFLATTYLDGVWMVFVRQFCTLTFLEISEWFLDMTSIMSLRK